MTGGVSFLSFTVLDRDLSLRKYLRRDFFVRKLIDAFRKQAHTWRTIIRYVYELHASVISLWARDTGKLQSLGF
ncbi:MAG: hypothetical protein K0S20_260 [Patescibacteria group bacterium]|nr:hypothetical protein [Patescibacteria group bacterium]